jgi:hypothetical protein
MRPMTGSAKQSIRQQKWIASSFSLLAMTAILSFLLAAFQSDSEDLRERGVSKDAMRSAPMVRDA